MRRLLGPAAVALAILGVAVAAAGCGGGSSSDNATAPSSGGTGGSHMGGTLKLEATGSPDYIDPALAYTVEAWQSLIMTDDGLVAFHITDGPESTQLVPDLATEIAKPQDGGLRYVFNVRPGIKYSNGATVKPSDFTFAFERSFKVNGAGTFYWANLEGYDACITKPKTCDLSKAIVADDSAGTVTFHLTKPDGDFLYKLAMPFAYALPPSTPIKVGHHQEPARHRPIHDHLVQARELVGTRAQPELQGVGTRGATAGLSRHHQMAARAGRRRHDHQHRERHRRLDV